MSLIDNTKRGPSIIYILEAGQPGSEATMHLYIYLPYSYNLNFGCQDNFFKPDSKSAALAR